MKREQIKSFIQDVLVNRFPKDTEKQTIEELDEKLVFACPFCGDSERRSSIKRGNFWFESKSYKCFNGGCLIWLPLDRFLSLSSRKFSVRLPEDTSEPVRPKFSEIKVSTGNPLIRFYSSKENSNMLTLDKLSDRFGLYSMSDVIQNKEAHPNAYSFLIKRGISEIDAPMFFDQSDDRVLIFNYDRKTKKILGYAIRKFNPTPDEPKYVMKYYSDLIKLDSSCKISDDLLKDANFLNNYFNILNVNFNEPIIIAEGQIDSLFLNNAIASSGLGKIKILLSQVLTKKNNLRLFLDHDKDGTRMTMELLSAGYSVFLWGKALSDLKKMYCTPENIIKIRGIKDINDLYLFIKSKQPDLTISQFNNFISNFFSDSMYDLVHL